MWDASTRYQVKMLHASQRESARSAHPPDGNVVKLGT